MNTAQSTLYQTDCCLLVSDQVIRNFELMGRVNLDQLEMIKEQGSSAEEEEAREIIEMVRGRKIAAEDEDEDEDMDMMENMEEEQREMDDDVMEGNIKEEEEDELEDEEDVDEVRGLDEGKPRQQGKYK